MSPVNATHDTDEARILQQFDRLVSRGELFWEHRAETKLEQRPFDVYFHISPIVSSKPYNPHTTSRKPAFQDEDLDFVVVSDVLGTHKLIMNKFCWLRPQLILHTLQFESQTDLLTVQDFNAAWEVLGILGQRYMVIFNGGPDAGSSVAHKHLQVFPTPEWRRWTEKVLEDAENSTKIPFQHRVERLPHGEQTTGTSLAAQYTRMCTALGILKGSPHNIILDSKSLLVLPRRSGKIGVRTGGANAMLGMLWMDSEEKHQEWLQHGPVNVLTEFGVPVGGDL